MAQYLPEEELSALSAALGADRANGDHVASNALALFAATAHLHGLTKTARPLVQLAALAVGAPASDAGPKAIADAVRRHAPSIDPAGRRMLAETLGLLGGDQVATPHEVALRVVPVVRLARALDASGTRTTQVVGAWDDGVAVEVLVSGGSAFDDAGAALREVTHWNALMPRPICSVKVWDRDEPPPDLLLPRHTLAEAVARIQQRQIEQFLNRTYGLRSPDVEYVHESRVALRRLRAATRLFHKALDDGGEALKSDARRFARQLGAVRDLDVFLDFLRRYAESIPPDQRPFIQHLARAERSKRRRALLSVVSLLESDAFETFKARYAQGPGPGKRGKRAGRRVSDEAPKMLARTLRRVTDYDRPLYRYPPVALHRLRIACKRLRYAGEFLADVYPGSLRELVTPMEEMQDALGLLHDVDVYTKRVMEYAERRTSHGGDALQRDAVSALIGRLVSLRKSSLGRAASVWKAFRNRKTQEQIDHIITTPRKP